MLTGLFFKAFLVERQKLQMRNHASALGGGGR